MVTKNWYYTYKTNRAECVISNAITLWNGSLVSSGYAPSNMSQNTLKTILLKPDGLCFVTSNAGIVLGSGTAPATRSDYKLENQITSGLTHLVTTITDEDGNRTYKLTLNSTTSEPITIGEIGIMGMFLTGGGSGTNYALMERTVLDEPVTIPAGGVGVVEYTIRLQMPEA